MSVTLAVFFFIFSFVIIVVSRGIEIYFNFSAQQETVVSEQHFIAQEAASAVKNFIQEKFSLLAATVRISGLSAADQENRKLALEKLLGFEPAFRRLWLFDASGLQLARVSRLSDLIPNQLIERAVGELFSSNIQGKTYISGSVYIDEETSEPLMIIAVPVKDIFGDFKGILAAETNLKFMWDLVSKIKVGEKGLAYVVDKQGNLIAFGDISRVLKGENLVQLHEVNEFVGNNSELAAKSEADINIGILGNYVVSSFVPLDEPDWAVMVELPVFEAYQSVIRVLTNAGIIMLITIAVVIFAGIFLSKRVTRPIINLRDAAREISKGKFDTKIEIESKDEIGELAADFNIMAVRLSAYTGELESKVAERTEEINKKVKELVEANVNLEETKVAMLNLIEDARLLGEELRKERDRVNAIITSMGEGLIVVDKEGRITYSNPAAGKLLGVSQDKIKGQYIDKIIPLYAKPEGKEVISLPDRPITKAIRTGKVVISTIADDFYFESSSGRRFAVMIVATPFLFGGKEIFGAVTIFRDITAEKQLDDAKTSFISVSSHQLRTPLTSIRWFSEMLMAGDAGPITPEQKHFVERIYEGTDRMIALVNLFLQIARVEAGRVKIEPMPIDFKVVTQGVLATLKTFFDEKEQKVVIRSEPEKLPLIPMDQEIIWQVIQNLLTNANRYSPPKSEISVSIVKKGEVLEYSVKNEGIGIPKNQQSRIFQKFFRAENALKYVPTGSGLGLSLVKLLVEGWSGKIWFESEENKGATFYFTVPVAGTKAKEGEVRISV